MNRAQAIEAAAKSISAALGDDPWNEYSYEHDEVLVCHDVEGVVRAASELRKALALPADDGRCKWKRVDGPYPELWETECCHVETFLPGEMGWVFCPFCGKYIESIEPAQDDVRYLSGGER